MKSYSALLVKSKEPRFSEFPIVLKACTSVHRNIKLSWIEEIDEYADKEEVAWYNHVVKYNVRKVNE